MRVNDGRLYKAELVPQKTGEHEVLYRSCKQTSTERAAMLMYVNMPVPRFKQQYEYRACYFKCAYGLIMTKRGGRHTTNSEDSWESL